MSWDLYVRENVCDDCGRGDHVGDWNYTHNTNCMMRDAGCGPEELNGLRTDEAAKKLGAAIRVMESDPEKYRAMNPDNGWGDYDRLLVVLREILRACEGSANGKVEVSM